MDELQLYLNCSNKIKITNMITMNVPTIQEITELGEKEYLKFCQLFTLNRMDDSAIVFLDSAGIDFMKISDWELFFSLIKTFPANAANLLFADLDFSSFRILNDENQNIYIENKDGVQITEAIYKLLVIQFRKINNIPKPKFSRVADNEKQKQMAINHAKNNIENAKRREMFKPSGSFFMSLISFVRLYYSKDEILNMNIFEFWENFKRVQATKNADNLYHGLYSGCLSLKENPSLKNELNYLRNT